MWNPFHKREEVNYEKQKSGTFDHGRTGYDDDGRHAGRCGGEDKGSKGATSESGETVITFGIHVANPAEQEPVTNSIVERLMRNMQDSIRWNSKRRIRRRIPRT